jgi:hypothetical protein
MWELRHLSSAVAACLLCRGSAGRAPYSFCCVMQLWCKLSAFSILGAALVPLEKQTAREKVNYAIQYLRALRLIQFCIFLSMETGKGKL